MGEAGSCRALTSYRHARAPQHHARSQDRSIETYEFHHAVVVFLSGDGSIDFMEFLEVMASKMGEHTFEDDLRDAFQLFDRDCNGYISKRELTFVMTSLGEQMSDAAVENMIKEVDLDGDGRVNYEGITVIQIYIKNGN